MRKNLTAQQVITSCPHELEETASGQVAWCVPCTATLCEQLRLASDAGATVQRVVEAATRMANHDYGGHSIPFGILGELRQALAALEND